LSESTTTQKTKPQKKVKSQQSTENDSQKDFNSDTLSTEPTIDVSQCPHANIPLKDLNSQELAEVLACTQEQVENIEKQIEQTQEQEKNDSFLKKKTGLINRLVDAPRCPYATTPLKKLKAHQLEEVYAYTQTHKMDSPFMIELFERLIALSDNHASVKQYKLQLADTHHQVHHIEKAAACYEDFAVMYPGSEEAEYALYKALACMFELSLDADRDQTNTKKTITLVKEFLKRAKNQNLMQEAQEILQKCYDRLYEHEVYVFNFYTKKGNFTAAQMRLDYITKTFTETIAQLDEKIANLTIQLESAKNPIKPSRKYIVKKLIS